MAAHIDQQTGIFRADRPQRPMHTLPRRHDTVGDVDTSARRRSALTLRRRIARPVRGHARRHLRAPQVGPQPLAGLELSGRDQRTAVLVLAPAQPDWRALCIIEYGDAAGVAECGWLLRFTERMGGCQFVLLCSGCSSVQAHRRWQRHVRQAADDGLQQVDRTMTRASSRRSSIRPQA